MFLKTEKFRMMTILQVFTAVPIIRQLSQRKLVRESGNNSRAIIITPQVVCPSLFTFLAKHLLPLSLSLSLSFCLLLFLGFKEEVLASSSVLSSFAASPLLLFAGDFLFSSIFPGFGSREREKRGREGEGGGRKRGGKRLL